MTSAFGTFHKTTKIARAGKPGWGSFEKVASQNLTPVKFGISNQSLQNREETHGSTVPPSDPRLARIASHIDKMKSLTNQKANSRVFEEHLPKLTQDSRLEIPQGKTEEEHFRQNPWVFHTNFPYYRQFLSRDLPSRSRASKKAAVSAGAHTPTPTNGRPSARKYSWNTWSLIPQVKADYLRTVRKQSSTAEFHQNESIYRDHFPTYINTSHKGAYQLPVSLYTRQRLQPDGISMIRDFITDAEEKDIVAEIMSTTLHRGAIPSNPTNYIPEDGRYCTNYFDTELSIPGKGKIAWSMADLPLVGSVLFRAFQLNLIPRMPNTFQINEYVTDFAGFGKHKKPDHLGSYIGILSLISSDVLRMYHDSYPWSPRVYLEAKSLVVLQREARYDYSMATLREKRPKASANTKGFRDSTRRTHMNFVNFTKDYRIDIMFAFVDVENHKALDIASRMNKCLVSSNNQTNSN